LYYPYIHPRDLEWVKGTLLSFGQINRLVPDGYPLDDLPEVARLRDEMGADGEPLVCPVSPEGQDIESAQGRLYNVLTGIDPAQLGARFGRQSTMEQFGADDGFEIHENKFQEVFLSWLRQGDLAWPTRGPGSQTGNWWAVHPLLGEALMSVMAIAAARNKGLDVVTESARLHAALASLDEQQVLGELLRPLAPPQRPSVPAAQVVDQLGHIVMTTMLDLRDVTVEDIAALVRDGNDLRRFREGIARIAMDVPLDAAPEVRDRMLRDRADAVIAEWNKRRNTFPKKLRDALRATTAEQSGKALEDAGKAIAQAAGAGGSTAVAALFTGASLSTAVLSAGVGFAIGFIVMNGRALFAKNPDDPFQYLSRIEKAGATLLTVPRRALPQAQA
jgi:hypothetical protein